MKKLVIVLALLFLVIPISFTKQVEILGVGEEEFGEGIEAGATYYAVMNDQIVASVKNNEVNYYHKDRLGSNVIVVGRSKTLPFGQELLDPDSRFTFTGKEEDSSGLYYFGARYYDSDLGRFVSVDPVVDNVNPFVYVRNNPLYYTDPTGEAEVAHIMAGADLTSQQWMGRGVESVGGTFYAFNRENFEDLPETTEVFVISGHHVPGTFSFWGEEGFKERVGLSELPESESVCVVGLSGCRTVVPPAYRSAETGKQLGLLLEKYPNLELVVGYWSKAPLSDPGVWLAFGEIFGDVKEDADYGALADRFLRKSRELLGGGRAMAYMIKTEEGWKYYSLSDYKEGVSIDLEKGRY